HPSSSPLPRPTSLCPLSLHDALPIFAALNRTFLNPVELTVRAVLEERPDFVRHAAMLDPNTAATLTLDEIDALCEELTRAHGDRSEEHTSELQSRGHLVCRLLLEKKK